MAANVISRTSTSSGRGRSGGGGGSLAVIPIAFIFYFIYALLLFAIDTGLYVTVWHRSILADGQRSSRYNGRFVANSTYEENDGYDDATVDENEPLRTFDRQSARSYGQRYLHLENNYRDCTELRKAIIVPNTQTSRSLNLQQLLSDHTINYFRCVIANRFSTEMNGGGGGGGGAKENGGAR